jgi:hypothetical protein
VRRHRFDPFAFVIGALFVFLALFVLTGNSLGDLRGLWIVAIPAVVAALLMVLYAARAMRSRMTTEQRSAEDDVTPTTMR